MQGSQFLDFIMGNSTVQLGMLNKNINDTHYRAFMLSCLNLVLKDISNRQQNFHWRFLEKTATASTVSGQHTYDLPTDIDTNKILAIYDRTQDLTTKFIPYDLFVRLVADPSNDSGTSLLWTLFASSIRLYPVPNSVYTIYLDYIKTITALADNSGTTDIPAKYDPVIIDGLLVWAYKFDTDMGDWGKQQMVYEAGIIRMIQDNNMMIGETGKTESHRDKMHRGVVDGQRSTYFPLADPA